MGIPVRKVEGRGREIFEPVAFRLANNEPAAEPEQLPIESQAAAFVC